mmetsp:Transcript_101877/g.287440  ORF Transcript_101877/g.287440 Transcript_101877/m.287440 type:complete len:231 (+) Transcript_101877:1186-1878(+)
MRGRRQMGCRHRQSGRHTEHRGHNGRPAGRSRGYEEVLLHLVAGLLWPFWRGYHRRRRPHQFALWRRRRRCAHWCTNPVCRLRHNCLPWREWRCLRDFEFWRACLLGFHQTDAHPHVLFVFLGSPWPLTTVHQRGYRPSWRRHERPHKTVRVEQRRAFELEYHAVVPLADGPAVVQIHRSVVHFRDADGIPPTFHKVLDGLQKRRREGASVAIGVVDFELDLILRVGGCR